MSFVDKQVEALKEQLECPIVSFRRYCCSINAHGRI